MRKPSQKLQGLRVFGDDALAPSMILPDSFIVSAGIAGSVFTIPSLLFSLATTTSDVQLSSFFVDLGLILIGGLILTIGAIAFCGIVSFFSFLIVHSIDWSFGKPMTRKLVFSLSGGLALIAWATLLLYFGPPTSIIFQLIQIGAATIVGGATAMKFSDAETPTHRLQATRPVSLRFRIRQILVATGWISILFAIDGGNLRLVSFAASFAFGMSILWGVAYCRTACNFLEN